MTAGDASKLNNPELQNELQAAVAARRELGPGMEDEVLAAFLARVDQHIDQRLAQARPAARSKRKKGSGEGTIEGTMALSIPLIIVAGIFGGVWGIAVVVAGLVIINVLNFMDRWRS